MTRVYKFNGAKALIKKTEKGYIAKCKCGWETDPKESREEAIVDFETHVTSHPKHTVIEKERGTNIFSILLALLGFVYVFSPIDIVPDYMIVIGWIEDIIIGILAIIFVKKGLEGKSPGEIISDLFG